MKFRITFISLSLILFFIGLTACSKSPFRGPNYSLVPAPFDTTGKPKTVESDGLIYYTIKDGYGPFTVHPQDQVELQYTERTTDGTIQFSTFEKSLIGSPYVIQIAATNSSGGFTYVKGFREGVLGMKKGEERTIVVPPSLAYGGTTSSLANDTLIYDVKIQDIYY